MSVTNELEYRNALKEIGRLIDLRPQKDTPLGDQLDKLARDVFEYEQKELTEGRLWRCTQHPDSVRGVEDCNECEMANTLNLVHKADHRAIEMWKKAHPERGDLVWPDRAKMIFWLMERELEKVGVRPTMPV